MKILIAEDDGATLLLLQTQLRGMGHEVTATRDGAQAWATLAKHRHPVVVSDWIMPEMDGLELCRRIRAQGAADYTYVILLTAHFGREEYLKGMEAGADDFLSKAFGAEQLQARLRVAERILGLEREVHQLSGLLPICSYCRRIRDGGDEWISLEDYVLRHSEASFTHGACPECIDSRVRPEMERLKASRRGE